MLAEACRHAYGWALSGYPLPISVNVSAMQFLRGNILGQVHAALRGSRLPVHLLEMEITESVLMNRAGEVMDTLAQLRGEGVSFAIGDFGTGFSNMACLREYQSHKLKIDQSFIRGLGQDEKSHQIVSAIVGLAHSMDILVVAEGVETVGQLRALGELGCNIAQGYYYAKPLSAGEVLPFLNKASERGFMVERVAEELF